ncbi:hypothetical protein [Chryseobacterium echinoideorum]|uniref:hypothetical protein n=1 Tax=Chryseobacterium echinoideorum TaxID=1549648 RepID=UPI001184B5D1|nr:hypothetical protein [Chryseobacterium echinoideorum]
MKKIFVSVMLLVGVFSFSQSVTERYNSLSRRYEYFNSSGNIIGYKQYNSLTRQWEYYDLKSTEYQRKPRQYGEYIQPNNLGLIERALQQKQQNYDKNFQFVKSKIEYMINDIRTWDIDTNTKYQIISQFKDAISKNLDSRDIDYGSNQQTNIVIEWLLDTLEAIIKKVNSNR